MNFKNITTYLALLLLCIGLASCGESHDSSSRAEDVEDEYERGDNNGRMLRDGDFSIELAIFETGVPPEYRAWARMGDVMLPPQEVELSVRLIRLGGMDDISFSAFQASLRGDMEIYEPHSFAVKVQAKYQNTVHAWAFDSFEGRTLIEPAVAAAFGLTIENAGPATLVDSLAVYGRIVSDPARIRTVAARFDGVIRSTNVKAGQTVSTGATLFSIESNESLQVYEVTAPIAGVVTELAGQTGQTTNGAPLLTIQNFSRVWVELDVYPSDVDSVPVGTKATLLLADGTEVASVIEFVSPEVSENQVVKVRLSVDNTAGIFRPGQFVQALIEVNRYEVPLAVKRTGLQSFRDFTVVYGKFGPEYEVRMLELGRQDRVYIEVLGGLHPGTPYVTTNSFLVKADIEKSGASHDH
ncbi:MAG: cobalt-zinc-cadmium efflux system membrane fusion protein [Candidatus Azotimanducaceae bacterium]|jgi:cobalt-zinc-cadmium efflux system membrane fusion protein